MAKGLHPPGGVQWKPGPASTLLGPGPSLVPGATCSGLFKLHVTVAYAEGLGLDTTPARGRKETGTMSPRRQLSFRLQQHLLHHNRQSPLPPFSGFHAVTRHQNFLGSHFQRFLLGWGYVLPCGSGTPVILIQGHLGTLKNTSLLLCPSPKSLSLLRKMVDAYNVPSALGPLSPR